MKKWRRKRRSPNHPSLLQHKKCALLVSRCEPMDKRVHVHYFICLEHDAVVETFIVNVNKEK